MTIVLAVTFSGTPDSEDVLGARHAVFLKNRDIAAQNVALAARTPPGTPLPLSPFATPAELKASYLSILAAVVTAKHLEFAEYSKSEAGISQRFTLAQVATMHANLVARLNAGVETPAQIVSDTAA